jgi:hypothetical protein
MPQPIVKRSQRFKKAARAERDRLTRKRSQLSKKRETLQARIDLLDEEMEAVDQEIEALERLALPAEGAREIGLVKAKQKDGHFLLKGSIIRRLAVPLLIRDQGTAPIHYRDWLILLNREGYAVAGKRPDAVFLNQVVRSPLVRATTKAGYYEVDLNAVDQLREKLLRQQFELSELMRNAPAEVGEALNRHRERQRELSVAIARTERELDEAMNMIEVSEEANSSDLIEARAA